MSLILTGIIYFDETFDGDIDTPALQLVNIIDINTIRDGKCYNEYICIGKVSLGS